MKNNNDDVQNWSDIDSLRPEQNGCHFAGNIFQFMFLNENYYISV